ncbi:MAG: phenylalanine--tRNA ligase subunit beta [Patescibacteria group bacterium]
MLISKKWLSEFVKLPRGVSDFDLAKVVTLSTVEVEKVIDQAVVMDKMVVGVVKAVLPHGNADRLKVCQVDVGGRETQIVCGGTNVQEGMKVAVALPGARVRWHGEGELVELAPTKIRGEQSEGMICAGAEIGIEKSGEGEHEIMDLGSISDKAGTPLAKALGRDDVVFDIEHKSLTNRPDLMGHYGMAREIAALYRVPLEKYARASVKPGKGITLSVSVDDAALCPRYMAVALDHVVVAPSPAWLCNRLMSCGVRSINNVVDVTNFVMLELGQPMHAFDADKIGGTDVKIVVRTAKKGERLSCLDDQTYALDPERLLITDGKHPIAIAGVMGGKDSAVTDTTTRVVFESANFSPVSVRKTSTKLGLRSESSARFEKSLDPELCTLALHRAVALLSELCPEAHVASKVVDVYPYLQKPTMISLSADQVSSHLGTEISSSDISDILSRLGFSLKPLKLSTPSTPFSVTIPTWRATRDISIKEDVIEEVARIWGYDRIHSALPSFSIAPPVQDSVRLLSRRLRHTLALELATTEVYRYAFVSPETLTALGFDPAEHLKLANPLASDRPYLVRSLLPNLLEAVVANQHAFTSVSLFEIDRVFLGELKGDEDGQKGRLPIQPYHLAIAYSSQGDESPFAHVRGMVESVLVREGFVVTFEPVTHPGSWMHSWRSADILVAGKKIGVVAQVNAEASSDLGIDRCVAVAELNVSELISRPRDVAAFTSIPMFPDAKRDVAFVVDVHAPYADLESAVRAASPLLVHVELFDVFQGNGIEAGKKSMAVHLLLRSGERTLTSHEADQEIEKIRRVLTKQFGATMRS